MTTTHPGPRRRSQSRSVSRAAAASPTSSCVVTALLLRVGRKTAIHLVEREARLARSFGEVGDPALGDEAAVGENSDPIAQLLHLAQEVARQQHGETAFADE